MLSIPSIPWFARTAGLTLSAALAAGAGAATVVVPNANATTGGDAQTPAPFSFYNSAVTGSRDQVLYPASQFGAFGGVSRNISEIQFRPYPGSATNAFIGGTVNISNVVITLSTTARTESGVNTLDATYANNIGANVKTVYSGPLTLMTTTTDTNGGATKVFDYNVILQNTFAYNPSLGNLLLDVNIPTGATVSGPGFGFVTFDDVNDAADGVASIVNSSSGSATSGTFGSDGAIAQFTFAVPEPASIVTALSGGLLLVQRRRRN